jgi:hypothetical protein
MAPASPSPVARALEQNGYLRGSKTRWQGQAGHKEWLHFAIHAGELDLLVNLSLVDDIGEGARRGAQIARVVCLCRESGGGGTWFGDIDQHPARDVKSPVGRLELCFGDNHAVFRDGRLALRARMARLPIAVDLELEPLTLPSQANNLIVEGCDPIQWLVVPRLAATGTVTIGPRTHVLERAVAYHDHNWGYFRWGKNFAWEWGYAAPASLDDPWTLVFVRLSDRRHLTDLMQAIFLWKGERQVRLFRGSELEVWHEGLLRPTRVFKLPRVMALASPGNVTDVPQRLIVRARRGNDRVDLTFDTSDVAQVIIPNDDDVGVTIIHEVAGEVSVEGRVEGERFELAGPSIFEFLGE